MRAFVCLLTAALLALAPAAGARAAQERVALVIGNGAYDELPALLNPANDAALLSDRLTGLGFDVMSVRDGDRPAMMKTLDSFVAAADDADVALLFYAGHGIQAGQENYLLPVDATATSAERFHREAVELSSILKGVRAAGPRFAVVVLDACRDNPLPEIVGPETGGSEAGGRGLAPVSHVPSVYIAYATMPNQVAYDGEGQHSPFTAALAHYLEMPGLEVDELFRRVRKRVAQQTGGAQITWAEDGLFEPLVLNRAETSDSPLQRLNAALDVADPLGQAAALEGFLGDHPAGPLAVLAKARLQSLAEEVAARAPADADTPLVDWPVVMQERETAAAPVAALAFVALHGRDGVFGSRAADLVGRACPPGPPPADEAALFDLVQRAGDAAALERYLTCVPDGTHSERAQTLLARLRPEAAPSTQVAVGDILTDHRLREDMLEVFVGTGAVIVMDSPEPVQLAALRLPRYGTLYADGMPVTATLSGDAPDSGTRSGVDGAAAAGPVDAGQATPATPIEDAAPGEDATPAPAPPVAQALIDARRITYEPGPAVRSGIDEFTLAVTDVRAAGTTAAAADEAERTFRAVIEVHPCDELAGARFDTMAVVEGIFRNEIDAEAAEPACRRAVAEAPEVARFRYQLGRILEFYGDPVEARDLYEQAAARGHSVAHHAIGRLYENGRGVPRDPARAVTYYRAGAELEDPAGLYYLGRSYLRGSGVAQDYQQALRWLTRAAEAGQTFAYNALARMYRNGLGVEASMQRALVLSRASAEAGDIYGMENLGWMYQHGHAVDVDVARAHDLYVQAAEGGHPLAPIKAGLLYRDGIGPIPQDFSRAAYWFGQAVRIGNPDGFVHLGRLHRDGLGVPRDPALAALMFARAWWLERDGDAGRAAAADFAALPERVAATALQRRLAERGYDPGPVDGVMGPATRQALSRYVADSGHDPVTAATADEPLPALAILVADGL